MSERDELLLKDEELHKATIIEWNSSHLRAIEAQLAKAKPIIEKQERDRIIRIIEKEATPDYFTGNLLVTIKVWLDEKDGFTNLPWWQALKEEK